MAKAPRKTNEKENPVKTDTIEKPAEAPVQPAPQPQTAPVHVPVAERGIPLLVKIAAAPEGYLMLTQDEGNEIVDNGFASLDTSIVGGDAVAVRLTEKGLATVNTQTVKRSATTVSAQVRTDIPAPGKRKGGKKGSKYPFDTMDVGASFHIPATLENPDPLSSVASSLTFARAKFAVPALDEAGKPVLETVKVKEYEKDAEGKIVKDAEGKRVVKSESDVTRPKMNITKDFTAAAVDASDPDGVGARVWRIA